MSPHFRRLPPRIAPVLSLVVALTLGASSAAAQTAAPAQAPIERVRLTDGELSCRQIHTELGDMDKAIAEAKQVQASASTTTTAGQVGGVAAEAASRTGVFGQLGGLFGQLAGTVAAKGAASVAESSGKQSAQRAAEREKQALARKEHLTTIFLAKGCKASDPEAAPMPGSSTAVQQVLAASAAQSAQAAVAANMPAEELVKQAAANLVPAAGDIEFDRNLTRIAAHPRVVVPAFRVAFTVKTQASAYGGGGLANIGQSSGFNRTITQSQNKRVEMALAGADLPLLQALTDQLYADFIARLQASGKQVVDVETLRRTAGYEKLKTVEKLPYTTSPTGDPRNYVVLAPKALPLFFMHLDTHLGNAGPFEQDGTKAVNELSARLDAVALVPTLIIDIAELESSGRSNFRSGAQAEVLPRLGVGGRSELRFTMGKDAKIFYTGEMGNVSAKKPLFVEGEFGEVKTVESFDTAGLANALTMATGLQGAQHFVDKRELRVDRQKFAAGVLRLGAAFNRASLAALAQ